MAPKLYMNYASPGARAVLLAAKSIGLELELKMINITAGENLTPQYIKMNPQHTIPTLVDDDGFIICDSHAIMAYLVSKYAKDDSLYPKNLQKRALVDQRLHFDNGVAFTTIVQIFRPIMKGLKSEIDEEDMQKINQVMGFVEAFLEGRKWIAGDDLTIADFSLLATISSFDAIIPIDSKQFPKVSAWLKNCEKLPGYELNKKGLFEVQEYMKPKISQ